MGKFNQSSDPIRVYLFGAPRIEKDGQPIAVDTRKALAMLAYLVLGETGSARGYTRDKLAALLYPEADQSKARGALRRTLSTLRKSIGRDCIEIERERIELKRDCLWVDVLGFRENIYQIHSHGHLSTQVCRECLPLLEKSALLAEEEFLAGFSLRDSPQFDDWQSYQGEALRQERAAVLEKLSLGLAAQGDYNLAVRYARRWLALDNLHEEAHRRLMRLYSWKGQRNAALRQYRECVRILDQELGVPPLEETQRLYHELLENQISPPPSLVDYRPGAVQADLSAPTAPKAGIPLASALPGRGANYPLVGRSNELQALLDAYQTSADQGYLFVLEGEPGIGKSRLANVFISQVQEQGAPVIQARCYEGQAGLAYAPFLDGLNFSLAHGREVERLEGIPAGILSLVAQLAPALHAIFPDLPQVAAPESPGIQVRFFDALRQVIRALLSPPTSQGQPGVLFLDDLQWADQASIDLLAYLARRPAGIFLLAAWRSGSTPPDHLLRRLLMQSERENRGRGLHLDRLGLQDVTELLQVLPDLHLTDHFADHLYRETEGNPFFLVEYLDALLQKTTETGTSPEDLPPGVRSLLQSHLDSAGELGRQMLGAAAVIGRSFDYAILREVGGRSELETVEGLESLLQQGLVVEQPSGGEARLLQDSANIWYDFSHDKLRTLVYEQTSQARRRLLHQRCGDAYAGRAQHRREAAALAAIHYQYAGQLSLAAEWFQQAGEYARAVYANREAITHFQNALACRHPDSAVLQEAIGDLYTLSGNFADALESFQTAAAVCSVENIPRIEHKLGLVYDQRGEWDLAEFHFKSALANLRGNNPQTPDEKSVIYADLSRTAYRRGNTGEAQKLASQAQKLAEENQSDLALAQAYNNLGILARASGNYSDAIQYLQRSLEISQSAGDSGRQAAALNNMARVYAESGQLEEAIRLTSLALAICQQRGDRHREAALHNNLADLFHSSGQEQAAMQHLKLAVVIMADIGGDPHGEPQPEIWKLVEW
jgi:DNA-binding SARP family transcriptional activator